MAKVEAVVMSQEWLEHNAKCVKEPDKDAWVLMQGAPASGFARVTSGQLELRLTPHVTEFVPERYWDIRMFGELGEYHCWMDSNRQWRARFAKRNDADWKCTADRSYPLWGSLNGSEGGWLRLWEARGATVWVPPGAVSELVEGQPVVLKARLRLEADDSGVVGIVDAMLCGLDVANASSRQTRRVSLTEDSK